MKERVITGVVLAVALIPLLFVGEVFFYGALGILVLIGAAEMFFMIHKDEVRSRIRFTVHLLTTFILYGLVLSLYLGVIEQVFVLLFLFLMVLGFLLSAVFSESINMASIGKVFVSVWYVAIAFAAIGMVRSHGVAVLGYMLILSMVTDMFAYFIGIKFGKHRLAPTISPKKSVEGAVGGTIVAVLIASIYAYYMGIFGADQSLFVLFTIFIIGGVFVSVMAQLGDLVASKFKREHGIKDFSQLFPGHGGVMDRFDSSVFAAVALMIVIMISEVL